MQRLTVMLLILFIFVLVACGEVEEDENGAEIADAQVEETTENLEGDPLVTNDQEESTEVAEPEEVLGAEEILKRTYEAMSDLSSVHMNAKMRIHEEIEEIPVIEEKEINMTMVLQEPYSKHFALEITSDAADTIISEVYEMPDTHYIHSSVHDVEWGTTPNPNGSQELSRHIADASLEEFISHHAQFEVAPTSEYYELTISGDYDEFMTVMYGGVIEMLQTIGKETPTEIQDVINAFKIFIDKETFQIMHYNIHYEGIAPGGQEEYMLIIDITAVIDEYNEHDEIIVPDNVMNEAVPM